TARFLLDLQPLPTEKAPYVAGKPIRPVPSTPIGVGDHELQIVATYEGAGHVPSDYHFTVRGDHAFKIIEGETVDIDVRVAEEVAVPPDEALSLKFAARSTPPPAPPPPAAPPPAATAAPSPPATAEVKVRPAPPAPPLPAK